MAYYDDDRLADVDLDDLAQQAFDNRPSISGTRSCRGCSDPQCGYCEAYEEVARQERIKAEVQTLIRDRRNSLDMLRDEIDDNEDAIGGIVCCALAGDFIRAGERLHNLLMPRVIQTAERLAE